MFREKKKHYHQNSLIIQLYIYVIDFTFQVSIDENKKKQLSSQKRNKS